MKYLLLLVALCGLLMGGCDKKAGACITDEGCTNWASESACGGTFYEDTDCNSLGYTCPEGMICTK